MSAVLVKYARALGCLYLPINGTLDGVLQHRGRQWLVDWKSHGGELTPAQSRLVAQGWRIAFISTTQQLEDLVLAKGEPRP